MLILRQIRFCAAECERQQSGEMSVYHMCIAFDFSFTHSDTYFSHEWIQELGRLVEPAKNANGYRTTPVMIGDQVITADNIKHQVHTWISTIQHDHTWTPEEMYKEFELIHPFIDGNGRVGAILYNDLNGSLDSPIAPPDVFKEEE